MDNKQNSAFLIAISNRKDDEVNYFINSIILGKDYLKDIKGTDKFIQLDESKLSKIREAIYNLHNPNYKEILETLKIFGKIARNPEKRKSNTTTFNSNVLNHNKNEDSKEKDDQEIIDENEKNKVIKKYLSNHSGIIDSFENIVLDFYIQNKTKYEDTKISEKLFYRTLDMIFLKLKIHYTIFNKNS